MNSADNLRTATNVDESMSRTNEVDGCVGASLRPPAWFVHVFYLLICFAILLAIVGIATHFGAAS